MYELNVRLSRPKESPPGVIEPTEDHWSVEIVIRMSNSEDLMGVGSKLLETLRSSSLE